MAENYLSFYDLNQVTGFKSAKETNNKEEFERILYENGADLSFGYRVLNCLHRPRTSPIEYDGLMVRFVERMDKAWLKSGAASLEAIIDSSKDRSLIKELNSLDPSTGQEWEDRLVYLDLPEIPEVYDENEDIFGSIEEAV